MRWVVGGVVSILVLMAFASMRNPIHRCVRSREWECRTNLRVIAMVQQVARVEQGTYRLRPADLEFEPEFGSRALLLLGSEGRLNDRSTRLDTCDDTVGFAPDKFRYPSLSADELLAALDPKLRAEVGVRGDCRTGDCGFTALCVQNIDADPTVDVWTVSSDETTNVDGDRVPPLQPAQRVRDRD